MPFRANPDHGLNTDNEIAFHRRYPIYVPDPGIIQKYYVKLGPDGHYGGIYIWDSVESLQAFRESKLSATIAQAYQAIEPPEIEIVNILFQLRD